jgi:hypothetical protein
LVVMASARPPFTHPRPEPGSGLVTAGESPRWLPGRDQHERHPAVPRQLSQP